MGKSKEKKSLRPPETDEGMENQLISLANKQAYKMLSEGRAPASVVCHFLKEGSAKNKLEKQKLEADIAAEEAKTKAYNAAAESGDLLQEALQQFKVYSGEANNE